MSLEVTTDEHGLFARSVVFSCDVYRRPNAWSGRIWLRRVLVELFLFRACMHSFSCIRCIAVVCNLKLLFIFNRWTMYVLSLSCLYRSAMLAACTLRDSCSFSLPTSQRSLSLMIAAKEYFIRQGINYSLLPSFVFRRPRVWYSTSVTSVRNTSIVLQAGHTIRYILVCAARLYLGGKFCTLFDLLSIFAPRSQAIRRAWPSELQVDIERNIMHRAGDGKAGAKAIEKSPSQIKRTGADFSFTPFVDFADKR